MKKETIYIIGSGAAGFFTAANLDDGQYEIHILERAKNPMQKIKISGGGRCNVTHACFDPKELVEFYPRGHKELRSVFTKFQPGDTMEWFTERGLELKIERDNRIFPVTDSSESVMNVLEDAAIENGVTVHYQTGVTNIYKKGDVWQIDSKTQTFTADKIVFCTGSSPKAYNILSNLGLEIVPLVPSLFTFNIQHDLIKGLMGTSFGNAVVEIPELKATESGPLLITHWGLSGPAVLKLSAWCARELAKLKYQFKIEINFLGIPTEVADKLFLHYKKQHPKKSIGQAKVFEVSQRFWLSLLSFCKIDPQKQLAQLQKQEKQNILNHLCQCSFTVNGKSTFKEEFVTAGGVKLDQIDFRAMRAKDLDNFYIAGEVLDIDAITGGFNFQACWSEAWLIAQNLKKSSNSQSTTL